MKGDGQETFAYKVKEEICHNRGMISRNKKAFTYGMLLCGKSFSNSAISLSTEHRAAARLYAKLIFSQIPMNTTVTTKEYVGSFERSTYMSVVDDGEDRERILSFFGHTSGEPELRINQALIEKGEGRFSFFAGAFLACGNLTDPRKDYHLEFVVQQKSLADSLLGLLAECSLNFNESARRGQYVVYCKDSKSIEEALTMMGATSAMMEIVNVKILKDVRNNVNRVTNCETSNIEKTVNAATAHAADIRYLKKAGLFDQLEPVLKETALARIRYPELSLRELSERIGISRSGLNHRLQKISKIAKEARERFL